MRVLLTGLGDIVRKAYLPVLSARPDIELRAGVRSLWNGHSLKLAAGWPQLRAPTDQVGQVVAVACLGNELAQFLKVERAAVAGESVHAIQRTVNGATLLLPHDLHSTVKRDAEQCLTC